MIAGRQTEAFAGPAADDPAITDVPNHPGGPAGPATNRGGRPSPECACIWRCGTLSTTN